MNVILIFKKMLSKNLHFEPLWNDVLFCFNPHAKWYILVQIDKGKSDAHQPIWNSFKISRPWILPNQRQLGAVLLVFVPPPECLPNCSTFWATRQIARKFRNLDLRPSWMQMGNLSQHWWCKMVMPHRAPVIPWWGSVFRKPKPTTQNHEWVIPIPLKNKKSNWIMNHLPGRGENSDKTIETTTYYDVKEEFSKWLVNGVNKL